MPDPWEYPWFAAGDPGFRAVPWAHLDPGREVRLPGAAARVVPPPERGAPGLRVELGRRQPAGPGPWRRSRWSGIDGDRESRELERIFQKLLGQLHMVGVATARTPTGTTSSAAASLGLDGRPVDRSNLPEGVTLEQADGTGMDGLLLLFDARDRNRARKGKTTFTSTWWIKFLKQFMLVTQAALRLRARGRVRFYDRLVFPMGERQPSEGADDLGPAPAAAGSGAAVGRCQCRESELGKRFARVRDSLDGDGREHGRPRVANSATRGSVLVSVIDPDDLRLTLDSFSEQGGLPSPRGTGAVSKLFENNPYTLEGIPGAWIDYQPANPPPAACSAATRTRAGPSGLRSTTWAIRQFVISASTSSATTFKLEYPTGSGEQRTFGEIAQGPHQPDCHCDLALRAPTGATGRFGGTNELQTDPAWKDNLHLQRVLPRQRRRGPRRGHQTAGRPSSPT